MPNKTLKFESGLDTSAFDKSVEHMKRQLSDLQAHSDRLSKQTQTAGRLSQAGYGGIMGGGSPAETMRQKREQDQFIRTQSQAQQATYKNLVGQDQKLARLRARHQEVLKDTELRLKVESRINSVLEERYRLEDTYQKRNQAINQALTAKMGGPFGGGAGGGAGGAGMLKGADWSGVMPGAGGAFSKILGSLGMIGSAIGIGGQLYGNYAQSPMRTTSNLGAGVGASAGMETQVIQNRRSAFEAAFGPERARAAMMAMEATRGSRVQAGTGLAGNAAIYGGMGAAAGSVIPGVGSVAGGLAGGVYGAYRSFSDPAQRALALSAIPGGIGKRYNAEYESIMMKQLGESYQSALENLKRQNPAKVMASQYYEQNYMGNVQSQRAMGIGNQGFYGAGGFLQGGVGAGFTPEMMMEMSQGILGAGGSSRAAAGNSVLGNILRRNMNLTNAGSVLGTISGGVGTSAATEQATIKVLAEGMKRGLDDSQLAEENRKFTQATAEIIARSAAGGGADFERVANTFSRFMGENTVRGVEAARTAYEQYQQVTTTVTGPRGYMRAAGFLKDERLKRLSTIEKQAIMQIPEEQLNESNPMVAGMAEKLGISPSDFVGRVRGINAGSVSRFKQADELRDRLRARGVDVGRASDQTYMATLTSQDRQDVAELMSYQTAEFGYKGQREAVGFAAGVVGRPGGPVTEEQVRARMGRDIGRVEDTTIAETAKDFGIVLNNFREFKTEIIPSADAVAKFTDRIREMMIALRNASQEQIPEIIKHYQQSVGQGGGFVGQGAGPWAGGYSQPQSNKPK